MKATLLIKDKKITQVQLVDECGRHMKYVNFVNTEGTNMAVESMVYQGTNVYDRLRDATDRLRDAEHRLSLAEVKAQAIDEIVGVLNELGLVKQ